METGEDSTPDTFQYKYMWSPSSDIPLGDFLIKYKPSMVQNDGTKPWIWVRARAPDESLNTVAGEHAAVEEGEALLKEWTEKIESIKNDASIPVRSNKKTGAKSKKELREQGTDATEKLKELSIKYSYVCGKWLIFAPADKVDVIWSSLARSLVSGSLSSTIAHTAKVSTSPEQESDNHQHLICIYMPNVYDKVAVTQVMKVLLGDHGVNLTGVKSDLYTALGIDSKHPSGISSTIWKNTALMKDSEIKELKDSYFAKFTAGNVQRQTLADVPKKKDGKAGEIKSKPKPKKRVEDDPFASDEDIDEDEEKRKKELKAKKDQPKPKRAKLSDSDGEEDEPPKKRRGAM